MLAAFPCVDPSLEGRLPGYPQSPLFLRWFRGLAPIGHWFGVHRSAACISTIQRSWACCTCLSSSDSALPAFMEIVCIYGLGITGLVSPLPLALTTSRFMKPRIERGFPGFHDSPLWQRANGFFGFFTCSARSRLHWPGVRVACCEGSARSLKPRLEVSSQSLVLLD